MNSKKKWLAFLLAFFVPGVGHLYLGLNKLGLKFMIGAFLSIILIPILPMVFPFVLAVIWFYSLFDALQKATLINLMFSRNESDEVNERNMMNHLHNLSNIRQDEIIEPLWIGVGCLLAGVIILVRSLFPDIWQLFLRMHVGNILLAVILIVIGLWILFKDRRKKQIQE